MKFKMFVNFDVALFQVDSSNSREPAERGVYVLDGNDHKGTAAVYRDQRDGGSGAYGQRLKIPTSPNPRKLFFESRCLTPFLLSGTVGRADRCLSGYIIVNLCSLSTTF